jgi:hypothetical protein
VQCFSGDHIRNQTKLILQEILPGVQLLIYLCFCELVSASYSFNMYLYFSEMLRIVHFVFCYTFSFQPITL